MASVPAAGTCGASGVRLRATIRLRATRATMTQQFAPRFERYKAWRRLVTFKLRLTVRRIPQWMSHTIKNNNDCVR